MFKKNVIKARYTRIFVILIHSKVRGCSDINFRINFKPVCVKIIYTERLKGTEHRHLLWILVVV